MLNQTRCLLYTLHPVCFWVCVYNRLNSCECETETLFASGFFVADTLWSNCKSCLPPPLDVTHFMVNLVKAYKPPNPTPPPTAEACTQGVNTKAWEAKRAHVQPCAHAQFGHFQRFKHQRSHMLHVYKHKNRHKIGSCRINTFSSTTNPLPPKEINERKRIALFPWIYFCRFHWISWSTASFTLGLLQWTQWHYKEECDGNTLTFLTPHPPDHIVHMVQNKSENEEW